MLDKAFMKPFLHWLEAASDQELEERRAVALAALEAGHFTDREVIRDLKYLVKLIHRELAERVFRPRPE